MASPPGFYYFVDFLSAHEQEVLLQQLLALNFVHDRFRGQMLKRSYAQFGYAYVSAGQRLTQATPFPKFLVTLAEKAVSYIPDRITFEQKHPGQ